MWHVLNIVNLWITAGRKKTSVLTIVHLQNSYWCASKCHTNLIPVLPYPSTWVLMWLWLQRKAYNSCTSWYQISTKWFKFDNLLHKCILKRYVSTINMTIRKTNLQISVFCFKSTCRISHDCTVIYIKTTSEKQFIV